MRGQRIPSEILQDITVWGGTADTTGDYAAIKRDLHRLTGIS